MENRIYVKELLCYKKASQEEREKKINSGERYFDLSKLPCQNLKDEMREFILHRGEVLKLSSIRTEFWPYNMICKFIRDRYVDLQSFTDERFENMEYQLKIWLMKNGYSLTDKHFRREFGKEKIIASPIILYFRKMMNYFETESELPEEERDIWRVDYLPFPVRNIPSNPVKSINFTMIPQKGIRDQVKRAVWVSLRYLAVRTVQQQIFAMKRFSQYLSREYREIQNVTEIRRDVLEDYLVYINTEVADKKSFRSELSSLKSLIEQVGMVEENQSLQYLFLSDDIHRRRELPAYKAYSDDELRRLNSAIVNMEEQVARLLMIHQMMMNRISESLTLEQDCIVEKGKDKMIRIFMIKPMREVYKPASADLVKLIMKSINYTNERYGKRKYVFVNDENPDEPMRYGKIQYQLMCMIQREKLKDNKGELFGVGTHTFRNSGGRRLTEMHVDDITIAKLLGHADTHTVHYYRRFGNEALANETRKTRDSMDNILKNLMEEW